MRMQDKKKPKKFNIRVQTHEKKRETTLLNIISIRFIEKTALLGI
jgi:hypothetical protein